MLLLQTVQKYTNPIIIMVKLKNYPMANKIFVLLLTLLSVFACNQQKYFVEKIEGKKIVIQKNLASNAAVESFVKPYREHIDADLNTVLAFCPENLDKSVGKWQTNIGNFLADITFKKANAVFEKREHKSIDFCLLNQGGIRAIISKGNLTARNAFEVQPFENAAVVIALKGEQIVEFANYFVQGKKPHPLSGISFEITKDNRVQNILIQGKTIDNDKIYYVLTNDYLANGGDSMEFFKKGTAAFDLDYKLRNIIIDYFKDVDTLQVNKDIRIKELGL